jgi:hypothetical protein
MKHNKMISLGAVAVALAAVVGLASTSLAASVNTGSQPANNKIANWQAKHKDIEAKKQAVETALSKSDYQSWLTAVGSNSDQAVKVTADKFPLLVQAYLLQQEAKAKLDQARQIREQLGLKGPEQGRGLFKGQGRCLVKPIKSN